MKHYGDTVTEAIFSLRGNKHLSCRSTEQDRGVVPSPNVDLRQLNISTLQRKTWNSSLSNESSHGGATFYLEAGHHPLPTIIIGIIHVLTLVAVSAVSIVVVCYLLCVQILSDR